MQKKEVTVYKVDGISNCADLGTKPVTQAVLKKLLPMAGLVPLEILDVAEVRVETPATNSHIDPSMAKKMLQLLVAMQSLVPVDGQFIGQFTPGLDRCLLLTMMVMIAISMLCIGWTCKKPRQIETRSQSTQTDAEPAAGMLPSSSSRSSLTTPFPSEVWVSKGGYGTKFHVSYSCVSARSNNVGRYTPCNVCTRQT